MSFQLDIQRRKDYDTPRTELSPAAHLQSELPVPEKQGSVVMSMRAVEKRNRVGIGWTLVLISEHMQMPSQHMLHLKLI